MSARRGGISRARSFSPWVESARGGWRNNTLAGGLVQGLRFDIVNGAPSFRTGALPDEQGDITIEITTVAARTLNLLLSTDPSYSATAEHFRRSGAMRVKGDLSKLGDWLQSVHDPIVARTIQANLERARPVSGRVDPNC